MGPHLVIRVKSTIDFLFNTGDTFNIFFLFGIIWTPGFFKLPTPSPQSTPGLTLKMTSLI